MNSMPRITFSGLLDWFVEIDASKWIIHVQAAQFDVKEYQPFVNDASGFLVLNISGTATRGFEMHDDTFSFYSKVKGVEVWLDIPYTAVFAAVNPETGLPNVYPFFMDIENPTPPPIQKDLVSVLKDGNKALADIVPNNVIAGNFRHYNKGMTTTGPTAKIGGEPAVKPVTVQSRVEQRKWRVIKGGKVNAPAELPFVDVEYRKKRDARELLEKDMPPVIPEKPTGKVRELRSDGADGISRHFPDLDVSKCVFHFNKTPRPEWMTVIEGGK